MAKKAKVLALAAILAASISVGFAEAKTLKMATDSGAKGSPAGAAIEAWAKAIESGTKGDVKVSIYYQNELGGQQEVFDLLVAGDVDLMLNWPLTSYDKRIGVLYTPYMFTTWEEALEAYKPGGWLNKILDNVYSQIGLKFFGAWPEGFNGVATKGRFATTVDGAKGIKVRVPPVFPFSETLQALGYQTATVDWGELFSAIQTGVVDGDAANVIYWDYEYFRDVLDHYVQTKQQFLTGMLTMNLEEWEALTPEQQKVVQDAALSVMQKQFKEARALDESFVEKWKAKGNKYIEPKPEEIQTLAQKVRTEVWPRLEKDIGSELMKPVRENSAKF
ncbi:C4-dicarboxylate ABC transporter substrate-binding protein [Microvirga vignae]|uniref:C4-dicarboxylate ABC transporter substrate-binding protein n=1 Tax=Microvirga vignae TaxID=1225564 RepID=A0A0H1R4E3_9HYPH|nr:TRAP transporter substrate-binding protein DctP [Microvirga vignae]KLK90085.1 C4-dicarboxylate ABC transporter substrate-binding protein [Microvirga vignae]